MPWASTSTVAPSVAFEALFTTATLSPLDGAVVVAGAVLACEEETELPELLPHAANASDAASAGTRTFDDESILDSFGQANEKMDGGGPLIYRSCLSLRTPCCWFPSRESPPSELSLLPALQSQWERPGTATRACRPANAMRTLDPQSLTRHVDRLYRAAWALCGAHEDAEDLVQETFARVLSRPRVLRGDDDLYYLMRVLRNTFLTGRRTASRRPVGGRHARGRRDGRPQPDGPTGSGAGGPGGVLDDRRAAGGTSDWRSWRWTCWASPTGRRPALCACARRRSRHGCSGPASRSSSDWTPESPGGGGTSDRPSGSATASLTRSTPGTPPPRGKRRTQRSNGKRKNAGGVLSGEGTQ